jgi:hypothetical protein
MDTMQMVVYALAGIGALAVLYWVLSRRSGGQPFSGLKKQSSGEDNINATEAVVNTGDGNQVNFKTK